MANIDYRQYGLEPVIDYKSYGLEPVEQASQPAQIAQTDVAQKPMMVDSVMGRIPASTPMVDTFLGKLPNVKTSELANPENINSMINNVVGAPGFKVLGQGAKTLFNVGKNALIDLAPHEQAVENAAQNVAQASKEMPAVKPGAIAQGEPESPLAAAEDQLGRYLNVGGNHASRVANALKYRVGQITDYWKNGYKNLEEKLKGTQFDMPPLQDEDSMQRQIMEKLKFNKNQGKLSFNPEDFEFENNKDLSPDFRNLMSSVPKPGELNAADFLAKYRTFRDKLFDMRQLTKQDINAEYRKQLFEDIDKGDAVKKIMDNTLEKGLGEHFPEFKRLNEGYSSQVYPLRGNKIVQKATRTGKLSDNVAKELSGTAPGQEMVREIVKQDPEALRNVVGQRYAVKPNEIHDPNELMREYTNELPDLQSLLENKKSVLQDYAKRKDISLAEKVQAENKLSEMRKIRNKARALTGIGATVAGVPMIGKFMSKLMANAAEQNQGGENG